MKRYQLALITALAAGACLAKPVVQVSPGTKGGISRTTTTTWQLSDLEKKNTAMRMSQISATAIAPTTRIRMKEWTALTSKHQSCFYNTFEVQVTGKYQIKFNVAGKEVNAFDAITISPGQGLCVTRYLEMWVRGERPGDSPSIATTHVEMDGNTTDNEGRGTITVR